MANLSLAQHVNKIKDTQCQATPGVTPWASIQMVGRGVGSSTSSGIPVNPPSNHLALAKNSSLPPKDKTKFTCGVLAQLSECVSGHHHFAKRLYCGREWCAVCGKKRSRAHNRRIARILPKAMQISHMGYFVVELPDIYRPVYISKEVLNKASTTILDVFAGKRMGRRGRVGGFFERGLQRMHWFGDECPGKYNPHWNVLVDSEYIEPEKLESIKQALRDALAVPDLIVNYGYSNTPGQMFQKVEYTTRATFLNYDWFPQMANELFNFRNMRWWGSWKQEPVWGTDDIDQSEIDSLLEMNKLQSGVCPDCGLPLATLHLQPEYRETHVKVKDDTGTVVRVEKRKVKNPTAFQPVKWSKPLDSTWLLIWNAQEIGETGYFRIPDIEWNGNRLSPSEYLRLQQLEHEARNKPTVSRSAELVRYHTNKARTSFEKELEAWWDDVMEHENRHN